MSDRAGEGAVALSHDEILKLSRCSSRELHSRYTTAVYDTHSFTGSTMGGLMSEKALTHPIIFSLGVEPVIHSLNNTVPATKKMALIFRRASLFKASICVADFMKTIYILKGVVLRKLPRPTQILLVMIKFKAVTKTRTRYGECRRESGKVKNTVNSVGILHVYNVHISGKPLYFHICWIS